MTTPVETVRDFYKEVAEGDTKNGKIARHRHYIDTLALQQIRRPEAGASSWRSVLQTEASANR